MKKTSKTFPLASPGEKSLGWTLSYEHLYEIASEESVSDTQIALGPLEAIILALIQAGYVRVDPCRVEP